MSNSIVEEIPLCEQCGRIFSNPLKLKFHQRTHLPPEEKEKLLIPCPFCDKKFSKEYNKKVHVLGRHSTERNYVCEICGKRFSSSGNLSSHRQRQHIETKVTCTICHKICKNRFSLRGHMVSHKPPSVPCPICGVYVKAKSVLKTHILLRHSDDNPYKCSHCGENFKRKITFQSHMIKHAGLKPFACRFCGEGFAHPNSCKKHEKRLHKEQFKVAELSNSFSFQHKFPTVEELETILREDKNTNLIDKKHKLKKKKYVDCAKKL